MQQLITVSTSLVHKGCPIKLTKNCLPPVRTECGCLLPPLWMSVTMTEISKFCQCISVQATHTLIPSVQREQVGHGHLLPTLYCTTYRTANNHHGQTAPAASNHQYCQADKHSSLVQFCQFLKLANNSVANENSLIYLFSTFSLMYFFSAFCLTHSVCANIVYGSAILNDTPASFVD